MKTKLLIIFLFLLQLCSAQKWVDTSYQITTSYDIMYGRATDFKGSEEDLSMDVSWPMDDTPETCGRPLMVIVHGGAWYSGDKNEGIVVRLREDFTRRGYVTASVNYRLGMFNTHQNIDCALLQGWKCWNMADTMEWYRAYYRAIQDVRGALRFLVNSKEEYGLDPNNVFLVGESAGGFVVMGAGFIEDQTEVLEGLIGHLPDVPTPNMIYERDCIQQYGLANDLSQMNLSRSDLGEFEGTLNLPLQDSFRIQGVGSFYGGAFNNIFETKTSHSPALYLYHQPCDLIVPFRYNRILTGFSTCATGFPTYCQHIVHRPLVYGSQGIVDLIDHLQQNNISTCEHYFDNSGNDYSCLDQVTNASHGCHSIDDYWIRTVNLAQFFANKIDPCKTTTTHHLLGEEAISVYPNPFEDVIHVDLKVAVQIMHLKIMDVLGRTIYGKDVSYDNNQVIDLKNTDSGIYYMILSHKDGEWVYPIVKL